MPGLTGTARHKSRQEPPGQARQGLRAPGTEPDQGRPPLGISLQPGPWQQQGQPWQRPCLRRCFPVDVEPRGQGLLL